MKANTVLYLIVTMFFVTSCLSDKQVKGDLPSIDVRKNYPEKEILLTDHFELDLIELKQAYKENKLNGQLKELVATLDEMKDNNVFVFAVFPYEYHFL